MSSDEMPKLMINRLIVLIQIFVFPVYFYLWSFIGPMKDISLDYFFFWRVTETSTFNPNTEFLILKILAPLLFALPFTLFSIIRANRIANAYELMWRAIGKVRIDTRLFYLANAVFCLFFFILPFTSPILAVFGSFFAVKLLFIALNTERSPPALLIVIPGLILSIIPLIVAIAFYRSYFEVVEPILSLWEKLAPIFYGVVLCLACAMVIGNFFLFVREAQAEISYIKPYPPRVGFLLKTFLFSGIFLIFAFVAKWNSSHLAMFITNGIAVALSSFETLVRWKKGLNKDDGGGSGTIMVPIFIAINFIANYWGGAISLVVALSAGVFFVLFLLAYKYAEDEALF